MRDLVVEIGMSLQSIGITEKMVKYFKDKTNREKKSESELESQIQSQWNRNI